jgi:hypothetical protein
MEFKVLDPQTQELLARVRLNGYSIEAGGPLGRLGAMRSFTLLEGSLRAQWAGQQQLLLKELDGRQVSIRIAALPVEEGDVGFVEFL